MNTLNKYTVYLSDWDNENSCTMVCEAISAVEATETAIGQATSDDDGIKLDWVARFVLIGEHVNLLGAY